MLFFFFGGGGGDIKLNKTFTLLLFFSFLLFSFSIDNTHRQWWIGHDSGIPRGGLGVMQVEAANWGRSTHIEKKKKSSHVLINLLSVNAWSQGQKPRITTSIKECLAHTRSFKFGPVFILNILKYPPSNFLCSHLHKHCGDFLVNNILVQKFSLGELQKST